MKTSKFPRKSIWALTGTFLVVAAPVLADGPFTQGNIVLTQVVGDDSATPTTTLSSKATRLRLVEYTLSGGVLVATGKFYNLPGLASDPEKSSVTGNNFLAPSGTATSEARVQLSADGRYLIVTGYNATIGTTGVVSTRSATVARVVGRVDWRNNVAGGAINTTTALTDAYDGNNIRSAASLDGTGFYTAGTFGTGVDASGTTGGLRYALLSATTSTQIENNPVTGGSDSATALLNTRTAILANGRVHVVSGTAQLDGSATFNPGLPTTLATAVTEVNTLSTTLVITNTNPPPGGGPNNTFNSFPSPYDIYFADANTAYVADSRGYDFTAVPSAPTMSSPNGNAAYYTQQSARQYVGTTASAGPFDTGTQFYRQSGGGVYRFRRNPLTNLWSSTPDAHFLVFAVNPSNGAPVTTQVDENADGTPSATRQTQNAYVGIYGLTGTHDANGNVVLYAVTADNRVLRMVDSGTTTPTMTQVLALGSNGASTGGVSSIAARGVAVLRPVVPVNLSITGLAQAGNGNDGVAPNVFFTFRTPGTFTALRTITDVPYPDGRVFVGDAPVGTYDLAVQGFNTLQRVLPSVAVSSTNSATPVSATLLPGDANGDNSVDFFDVNLLAASFNAVSGPFLMGGDDPNFDRRADFNYDGSVDFFDVNLLAANYNNVGDD